MLPVTVASETNIPDYDSAMEYTFIIILVLLFAALFYLFIHIGLSMGLKNRRLRESTEKPFVSVIVAARNEEKNIAQLLHRLTHQTYSEYEVIIINDRSTDQTARLISEYQAVSSRISRIDITHVHGDMPAKKNALRAGIKASKGEILCFTDADCLPTSQWIEECVKAFTPGIGLVAGYSPYTIVSPRDSKSGFLNNLLLKFIGYEEYRAAVWSAGSIGWNMGWLCTGRNLAYRRTVYNEVNGFENIKQSISGDDDLFLQLVRKKTAWKISYLISPESFVQTSPPMTLRAFITQRTRHFSAAKFFPLPMKIFFSVYHFSNGLLFLSPFLFLMNIVSLSVMVIVCCIKISADYILFSSSHHIFEAAGFRASVIPMEALYVLYNLCIGPLGLFRKFAWKQI
jgi:cellulose synthase/poly-beta-1,6-N-acetylglucosamine synthase-like glycosyltransferase